jgi:CysZ protein
VVRRYAAGVRLLAEGVATLARTPRLLLLGLVPAVVTAVLFAVFLAVLLILLADLAAAVTWFAADWPPGARTTARVLAGAGLLGVAMLVGVLTYTAVTLLIGEPFYAAISRQVEGEVPGEVEVGFWRGLGRSVTDSARVLAVTPLFGLPLFLAGFVPVVGQTLVPVAGATAGGWLLALQLAAGPFDRRGLRLADRRRALRAHLPETLGFGTAVFVCFLLPGGAVLLMPAAVAGGTMLARRVLQVPDGGV